MIASPKYVAARTPGLRGPTRAWNVTLDTPAADAATASGVLTRAEYRRRAAAAAAAAQAAAVETSAPMEPTEEIAATPSLAETVVADVAAAIAAETALGAQPCLLYTSDAADE